MSQPPLLCLLPGLLCDGTVWEDQRRVLSHLAPIHIADFGALDAFLDMARKVLEETSGPLAVAGHSMGARVALEMWRLAPERIVRLALISTGVHPPSPADAAERAALVEIAVQQGMTAVTERWLPEVVHPARLGDQELIAPLAAMIERYTPERFAAQQRAGLNRPDASSYLPRIACPTLILCGREDGWSPVAHHEEMARAIPGASLCIVERCAHMATVERPAEVTAALQKWLAEDSINVVDDVNA